MFKAFSINQPKFFNFVKNRFNIKTKNGLYLTICILVVSFFTFIFINLKEFLINETALSNFDLNYLNRIQSIRTPFLNTFMSLVTHLADWQVILFAGLSVICILVILKKWRYVYSLIITTFIGEVIVYSLKIFIKRQGPPLRYTLLHKNDFSFPSGHSFIAVAFYGLVFYFVFKFLINKTLKTLSILIGTGLIILVGFSRIYLGVHWPSDVFASFISGTAFLTMIITFLEIDNKFNIKIIKASITSNKFAIIASTMIFISWFTYFIIFYLRLT